MGNHEKANVKIKFLKDIDSHEKEFKSKKKIA